MRQTISIANQKGGVGKTTTALNLAFALALRGKKVLLVDMDPQGSATSGIGISSQEGIYTALMQEKPLKDFIVQTAHPRLHLAPATPDLAGAEMELAKETDRVFFLKNIIRQTNRRPTDKIVASEDSSPSKEDAKHAQISNYDFILIDTPPSLGLLSLNALTAGDSFIVPLQCEYYALEGLGRLLETAREVQERWNPALKLQGILLTLFDARNSLSYQVEKEVRRHFGDQVFDTFIPRNVRLSEAPGFGKSIFQYEPHCLGATAYEQLAKELENKITQKKTKTVSLNMQKEPAQLAGPE